MTLPLEKGELAMVRAKGVEHLLKLSVRPITMKFGLDMSTPVEARPLSSPATTTTATSATAAPAAEHSTPQFPHTEGIHGENNQYTVGGCLEKKCI